MVATTRIFRSNPWPKTFSPVILTVDLGPEFHKHNARLAYARDANDTVMLGF